MIGGLNSMLKLLQSAKHTESFYFDYTWAANPPNEVLLFEIPIGRNSILSQVCANYNPSSTPFTHRLTAKSKGLSIPLPIGTPTCYGVGDVWLQIQDKLSFIYTASVKGSIQLWLTYLKLD